MNWKGALLAIAALVAVGGLVFLLRMTQSVDGDLHQSRLELIRQIDTLDVQLNRAITQARFTSLAQSGEERVVLTNQLGDALTAIGEAENPISLRGLDAETDQALDTFLTTIEDKFVLAFDFEARNTTINQRLINSLDAVPRQADAVLALATADVRPRLADLLSQLKSEAVIFSITPAADNAPAIQALLDELTTISAGQPPEFQDAALQLAARATEVVAEKNELNQRLDDFLNRPTAPQLRALETAYNGWFESQVAVADQYRQLLAGYAAALLLLLAWLGLRLRRSYRDLDRANDRLTEANVHLEEQVEERTKDLRQTLADLRASEAQLIQSEKMASLGQMVAGVAHEINTPLGYARSNAGIVRSALADLRAVCVTQSNALRIITSAEATDEAVAQAVAEAHAQTETVKPDELVGELDSLLSDTDHGLVQIADLVGTLKDFSRVDRSRTDLVNVNDCVESALKICNNQLKGRIEVVKQFGKLPQVECSPSQINQVFLNLFTNAAQAISGNGKIFVHTAAEADGIAVRVLDTGCGMSEEVRQHIFEPFFTTKPVGKGTGLGLSIVFRIVEDHGGRIEVRSTPGKGSEFAVHLPLRQKAAAAPAAEAAPAAPTDAPETLPTLAAA